jgi:hypothetical protein
MQVRSRFFMQYRSGFNSACESGLDYHSKDLDKLCISKMLKY